MKHCPKCGAEHDKPGIFCSRSCANSRVRDQAFKDNASAYAKANPVGWAANPKSPRSGEGIKKKWAAFRKNLKCCECGIEFEVPYSQRNRKYCSVDCSNKNKFHVNSNRKKTSIHNGFKMDSGAELAFAQLCDKNSIHWVKNTTVWFEYLPGKRYYPDFYLKDFDLWVEIKGKRYFREDDPIRWASVPNHEVIWSNKITLPTKIMATEKGIEPS